MKTAVATKEKKESLLDLTDEMAEILVLVEEEMERTGGEIVDGEPSEALVQKLDALNLKLAAKADGYASLINHFWDFSEAVATMRKKENTRMQRREKAAANKAARLMYLLEFAMKRLNLREIRGVKHTIAFQLNGGVEPMQLKDGVTVEELPEEFVKTEKSVNSAALRAALEAKNPEAMKFAELLPRGERLAIR